ncbi:MAG: ATP-binding protein [Gemmataceae bacterium]|nr:ATP-binding protein [Gemmataceae bacterium]
MSAVVRQFSLSLPSELRFLSVARSFVEAVGQAYGWPSSVVHAVVLAAGEAVANIIRHAHRDIPAAHIQLQLQSNSDGVVLTLEDEGRPFDFAAVPYMNPRELRVGGRGVYLIRSLMDEVVCQPRSAGQPGNTLRMVKHFGPVPARAV